MIMLLVCVGVVVVLGGLLLVRKGATYELKAQFLKQLIMEKVKLASKENESIDFVLEAVIQKYGQVYSWDSEAIHSFTIQQIGKISILNASSIREFVDDLFGFEIQNKFGHDSLFMPRANENKSDSWQKRITETEKAETAINKIFGS